MFKIKEGNFVGNLLQKSTDSDYSLRFSKKSIDLLRDSGSLLVFDHSHDQLSPDYLPPMKKNQMETSLEEIFEKASGMGQNDSRQTTLRKLKHQRLLEQTLESGYMSSRRESTDFIETEEDFFGGS